MICPNQCPGGSTVALVAVLYFNIMVPSIDTIYDTVQKTNTKLLLVHPVYPARMLQHLGFSQWLGNLTSLQLLVRDFDNSLILNDEYSF